MLPHHPQGLFLFIVLFLVYSLIFMRETIADGLLTTATDYYQQKPTSLSTYFHHAAVAAAAAVATASGLPNMSYTSITTTSTPPHQQPPPTTTTSNLTTIPSLTTQRHDYKNNLLTIATQGDQLPGNWSDLIITSSPYRQLSSIVVDEQKKRNIIDDDDEETIDNDKSTKDSAKTRKNPYSIEELLKKPNKRKRTNRTFTYLNEYVTMTTNIRQPIGFIVDYDETNDEQHIKDDEEKDNIVVVDDDDHDDDREEEDESYVDVVDETKP